MHRSDAVLCYVQLYDGSVVDLLGDLWRRHSESYRHLCGFDHEATCGDVLLQHVCPSVHSALRYVYLPAFLCHWSMEQLLSDLRFGNSDPLSQLSAVPERSGSDHGRLDMLERGSDQTGYFTDLHSARVCPAHLLLGLWCLGSMLDHLW